MKRLKDWLKGEDKEAIKEDLRWQKRLVVLHTIAIDAQNILITIKDAHIKALEEYNELLKQTK